jgi:hypothetical protein
MLAYIEPEGLEEVVGVPRCKTIFAKRDAKRLRLWIAGTIAGQGFAETIEESKLVSRRKCWVVGDVVCRSGKAIKGENGPSIPLIQEP